MDETTTIGSASGRTTEYLEAKAWARVWKRMAKHQHDLMEIFEGSSIFEMYNAKQAAEAEAAALRERVTELEQSEHTLIMTLNETTERIAELEKTIAEYADAWKALGL